MESASLILNTLDQTGGYAERIDVSRHGVSFCSESIRVRLIDLMLDRSVYNSGSPHGTAIDVIDCVPMLGDH